ncbi:hypothetical protein HG535_0G02120 [Zygotorulaspora mrakii]|uniref:precorrin-2 dehydrogenase n=1 Tax=Zygotorulaspora mrakii TaxID=42260 RepID=A0A7H9B6G8_ZYGMR|nr:uncharacterized protein HG535_0G02120 [Zygotorulaspora mrakii]QLG74328.1 hypothetical protein HG535_0G02120 [Zygotorulaspora mrakii]
MGGKSLIVAHQLEDNNVLLVGGGEVGLTRLRKLISTGSKVTLVSPEIHPLILKEYCNFTIDKKDNKHDNWNERGKKKSVYRIIKDEFKEEHLLLYQNGVDSGWSLILTCIPNQEVSEGIYFEAKKRFGSQQMVNVADNPKLCDIYFGANLEFGSNSEDDCLMQLMISSNGMGPRFVAMVRDEIGKMLGGIDFEKSLIKLGKLRSNIREITDNSKDIKYRMEWMKKCTEIYGVKNCENIDEDELIDLFKEMYIEKDLNFPDKEIMFEKYTENMTKK